MNSKKNICPHCGQKLRIPIIEKRIKVNCNGCEKSFFVPSKAISSAINKVSLGDTSEYFSDNSEWAEITDEGQKMLFAPSPKGEIHSLNTL